MTRKTQAVATEGRLGFFAVILSNRSKLCLTRKVNNGVTIMISKCLRLCANTSAIIPELSKKTTTAYLIGRDVRTILWTIAVHHTHATSKAVGLEMKNVRGSLGKEAALLLSRSSCKFLFSLAFFFRCLLQLISPSALQSSNLFGCPQISMCFLLELLITRLLFIAQLWRVFAKKKKKKKKKSA